MSQHKPKEFLERYLQGDLSEQDRAKLMHWYQQLPEQDAIRYFDQLGDALENFGKEEIQVLEQKLRAAARDANPAGEKAKPARLTRLPVYLKVAAAILVLLSVSFIFYAGLKPANQASAYQEKQTRLGQVAQITLADGSVVMLNAGSKLKYPKSFRNSQTREVFLEGEAFFTVAHDQAHPFIVHTPNGLKTRVLGTSFNINTYRNPHEVAVSVVTGKVAVATKEKQLGELVKDQQLTYNSATATLVRAQSVHANAWTTGELVFDGETLGVVAAELERAYNIQIEIDAAVAQDLRCSGKFNLKQKPEEIIQVLSILHELKHQSTDNIITISK
jgi:transmembrane sensor